MLDATEAFVREYNWKGPFELECMVNGDTVYLIEINPRFPAWCYFSAGVGINLPANTVRKLFDMPLNVAPDYEAGKLYVRYTYETVTDINAFQNIIIAGRKLIMKALYQKPILMKVQTGMSNKYGSTPHYARKIRTEIDGVSIDQLTEEYGSPLFVFSERQIRERYRKVYGAFSTRYPNVTFGWSYKTNYLSAVCAIMHQEGSIAEVVSEMEYEKARELGVTGENIIFNGPHKSMKALERAALEGAMINIDHFDELYDLEKVADKLGWKVKVGLRLNLDSGIQPQWSRFGFNLESGQALEAVKRIAASGKLELHGLHCHIGTYILDPQAYANQVKKMVEFGYQVEDNFGFKIDYLDIGGGLPSKSRLKGSYHSPDLIVPPVDEYG